VADLGVLATGQEGYVTPRSQRPHQEARRGPAAVLDPKQIARAYGATW
jgi:hypothetical protein